MFDFYDIFLLVAGIALLAITLGGRLLERLNLNSTYVYLLLGIVAGALLPALAHDDPLDAMPALERVAELAVVIGVIVLGIRIGRPVSWRGWQSTARLILLVMPATILAIAAAGVWILGLPPGPAVLLGAALAPTDPILAGPLEEHDPETDPEDRFGLSSEAGLNDGLAFPFVYLGIYLTMQPGEWSGWLGSWLGRDLVYSVGMALPLGWIAGRVAGDLYVKLWQRDAVSRNRRLFVPLAVLLAVYGATESLGGTGFLATFAAGHGFRHAFEDHPKRLAPFADFAESVDELAKAAVLVMIGAMMPWGLFWEQRWPLLAFGLLLLLVVRPALTLAATAGGGFSRRARVFWAWFGLRGIASIYYMGYAVGAGVPDAVARPLLVIVLATVLMSVLVHGLTVRPFLARMEGAREARADRPAAEPRS